MNRFKHAPLLSALFVTLGLGLAASSPARADVKHEGTWPEKDKTVSLDVSGASRQDAVKKLAEAAGWSIVTEGIGSGNVDLHVKDQPASRVLDLVLDDSSYVAARDEGGLVRIRRAATTAVAEPTMQAVPPVPVVPTAPEAKKDDASAKKSSGRGEDRTVFGSNVRIEADETVKDLTVFGGNVELAGRVTSDLTVFGGNVHVVPGGHVDGDATLLGGNLHLDEGTGVDGDVSLLGGNMDKSPSAKVGGTVEHKKDKHIGLSIGDDNRPGVMGFVGTVGHRLTSMAILFVFGTILLALAAGRMEGMRVEIASRPMRTFALGVVSFFGTILAAIVLCVTIIGIPLAAVGVLLAVLGGYAGVTAALTTLGAAVLGHRTQSPYLHLAFGCVALFLVGLIPFISGLVTVAVGALGLGVIVATRGAGFLARKAPRDMGPYRTDAL